MESIIILVILGWIVWMLFRHPFRAVGLIFKLGFLLFLGFGAFLVLFWFATTP